MEIRLIEKQTEGLPFSKLNDAQLTFAAKDLVIFLHQALSWELPAKEMFNSTLEIIARYLAEFFPSLNLAEAKQAALISSDTVETYNKPVNVHLLGRILNPYLDKRAAARERLDKADTEYNANYNALLDLSEDQKTALLMEGPDGWYSITELYYQKFLNRDYILDNFPADGIIKALETAQLIRPNFWLEFTGEGKRYLRTFYMRQISGEKDKPLQTIGKQLNAKLKAEKWQNKLSGINTDKAGMDWAAKLMCIETAFKTFFELGRQHLFIQVNE